jgi:hypothetical protein
MSDRSGEFSRALVQVPEVFPEPVWVVLDEAYKGASGPPQEPALTARQRAHAMNPTGWVVGLVTEWVRHENGSWMGLVTYEVPTVGLKTETVRHFVRRTALRKRAPNEVDPPF